MNAAPQGDMGGALVLDPSALARIREVQVPGEADLVNEMIKAFLEDARAQLLQLTTALACSDADALAKAAHLLKSGAGYLGAQELAHLCVALENLGRSGSTAGARVLTEKLQMTFELTRRALNEELARGAAAAT
jgi:HPt (histidine-containing phosphotransfer) domain-containing protein